MTEATEMRGGSAAGYRAVLVAQASRAIGGGHVARCMALANGLADRGWQCVFAVTVESLEIVPELAETTHLLERVTIDEYRSADALGARLGVTELLVVDDYQLDAEFEAGCRHWAGAVLVVDDLADRAHDADVLIDSSPEQREAAYRALVPENCRLMLGSQFALLRPQFAKCRTGSLARRDQSPLVERILVSVGSADACGLTDRVLAGLDQTGLGIPVDVVVGAADDGSRPAPDTHSFEVTVHRRTRRMEELLSQADLAIGSAGVTALERCCLGVPSIAIIAAENQRRIAETLAKMGALMLAGDYGSVTSDDIAGAVTMLAGDAAGRRRMSECARQVCDGEGVARVGKAMEHVAMLARA